MARRLTALFGPAIISGTKTYKIKGHGLGNAIPHQIIDKGVVTEAGMVRFRSSSITEWF